MNVVVIGGGIIGCSVAFQLARRGVQVSLLEANEIATGTSATSFAWVNSNNKAPQSYHNLNVAGMHEHRALTEEFEHSPWLTLAGNVMWSAVTEPDVPVRAELQADKLHRLRSWGYQVEARSRNELAESHPELRLPADIESALFFPEEGWVDAPLLARILAKEAQRHGAHIHTGHKVTAIEVESRKVQRVTTANGESFPADVVISCAGRWTDEVTRLTGVPVAMAPTLGMLATTSRIESALQTLVQSPEVNVRPAPDSRFVLANYAIDAKLTISDSPEVLRGYADTLLHSAKQIIPSLANAQISGWTIGVRSIPADGFPVVGFVPGFDGFYIAATHSGITLGPLLGRIVAEEVTGSGRHPLLQSYRPDRLI